MKTKTNYWGKQPFQLPEGRKWSEWTLSRKKKRLNRLIMNILLISLFIFSGLLLLITIEYQEIELTEAYEKPAFKSLTGTLEENRYQHTLTFKEDVWDFHWVEPSSWQEITVYKSQVENLYNRGYDNTRILDILALKSMECHKYNWNCEWIRFQDYWPFQINKSAHPEAFAKSLVLRDQKNWAWLFNYQIDYVNKEIIDVAMNRFCSEDIFKQVNLTYNNEKRFKCVAVTYNGSPRYKLTYAKLGWKKREIIKEWLEKSTNLLDR